VTERHSELTDEQPFDDRDDQDDEDNGDDREPIGETHPGFTITCDECGSQLVVVENDLEFSATVGRQGNVYLRCTECDAETFLLPSLDQDDPEEQGPQ
jgi:hypothetical protein